ncbi:MULTISPECIES: MFS transporter [Acidithrix]|uniref:Enterobactin exporter EntS n=1 Tax=Acidithrix ferrooxidans TaxID=1280514 RepID=A0A0D8HJY5_9ACTN|nr:MULTISPECIES: MFS transporter [Acidithrix]KJF18248.1 enterobactin exporter EntS [Acidithrix ferrooxidans]
MANLFVDLSPLRDSKNFRLLFIGQLISGLGDQITIVAISYEIYRLTHSSLLVGLVSLVQLIPLLLASLGGGPIIDRTDRRRLLIWGFGASTLAGVVLYLDVIPSHPSIWPIFALSAFSAGVSGIVKPAQSAVIPQMVARDKVTAAIAIRQMMFQIGLVVGPAVAGILIAHFAVATALGIDALTYLVGAIACFFLPPLHPVEKSKSRGLKSIKEGFSEVASSQILKGIFLIDLVAMVFGMPRALFPALALTHFHDGASGLGYLYSALGVGASIGAVTSGWVTNIKRQGLGIILSVLSWGTAIIVFGAINSISLALLLLAVAGYVDLVSSVLRNAILQRIAPPEMRGRLFSIQISVVTGGPRLGDLESGGASALLGTTLAVITGGVACVAGSLAIWKLLPKFSRYSAGEKAP